MTLRQRLIDFSPLVAALAVAALSGCVLDMSTKTSCERDDDCLDGYSCTQAKVCEANINLGPDATAGDPDGDPSHRDASTTYPDVAVYTDAMVEDGGSYRPDGAVSTDAMVEDGGAYDPDAAVEDAGTYDPDAAVYSDAAE